MSRAAAPPTAKTTPLTDAFERVWAVVRRIPEGRVATYGQVAAEAGFPKRPRLAGQALNRTPAGMKLPWHRVVNAQGRIALPAGSEAWSVQRRRLEAEGLVFRGDRIDLVRYRWQPRSLAPIVD
ncbi:MAG: methylated-DNA--[protein]-cysteine S-methyltransferase [Sinimarinibacterium sp.]|jgi:methylated-DNA-protein-cysteine methyltransferase-like protein